MSIPLILHLIASIVILLGLFAIAPRSFKDGSYTIGSAISWVGLIIGVALLVIANFLPVGDHEFLIKIIGYAILIAAMALLAPGFFSGNRARSFSSLAWYFVTAGIILGLIGECMGGFPQSILHSITYPVIIIGMLILLPKFFKTSNGIVGWLLIVAGLVLEIISVHA